MGEAQAPARRPRASAALDYPVAAPAADGSVVAVADGVLWARMPMPMGLDHINVYLLRGDAGWTLVDTGLPTDQTRALWEKIAAEHLGALPIERLVCTHFHYDHAGLAAWLTERFGVPLHMTQGEFLTMRLLGATLPDPVPHELERHYRGAGLDAEQRQRVFQVLRRDPFVPPHQGDYVRLRGGDVLNIGARRWLVVIGEGHSPEHACLYSAEDRLLIAGDQLLPRISSNILVPAHEPESNPLALWLTSLERLEHLAPDTLILPSHQGVFRGLHARTAELREHHRQQLDTLRRFVAEGGECSAQQAMRGLFPKLRSSFDEMLALGETIAHLSWLRHDGALQRRLDGAGVYRFSARIDQPTAKAPW